MKISYKKLWMLLIQRDITKVTLKQHSVILMLKKDIPHCPKWAVGSLHF